MTLLQGGVDFEILPELNQKYQNLKHNKAALSDVENDRAHCYYGCVNQNKVYQVENSEPGKPEEEMRAEDEFRFFVGCLLDMS